MDDISSLNDAASVLYPDHGANKTMQENTAKPELRANNSGTSKTAHEKSPETSKATAAETLYPDHASGNDANADGIPNLPSEYNITFSEDTQVDHGLLDSFTKEARALGISKGKAQKLAAMYEAHAANQGRVIAEAKRKWEAEIQASPTFKQEHDHARAVLREYGDKELYDLLDQTNLGSHPKMWAFLSKVGRRLAKSYW